MYFTVDLLAYNRCTVNLFQGISSAAQGYQVWIMQCSIIDRNSWGGHSCISLGFVEYPLHCLMYKGAQRKFFQVFGVVYSKENFISLWNQQCSTFHVSGSSDP